MLYTLSLYNMYIKYVSIKLEEKIYIFIRITKIYIFARIILTSIRMAITKPNQTKNPEKKQCWDDVETLELLKFLNSPNHSFLLFLLLNIMCPSPFF